MAQSSALLPVLNEAELRAIFRNDERAIWRYNVLAALLHEDRAARDVAHAFGTTTETVRSLRTSFLETGHLDALRSKRRGAAGHLTRQTPLAQAVARELAADPSASGGTIWRRVRARLADGGTDVPRRSVYRIIERLRPSLDAADVPAIEDELWAPALVPALRAALPLVRLDPPIDLGRSELAAQLLAHQSDPMLRGEELRAMISQALDQLRPPSDTDAQDPLNRPYQVLVGEVLRGSTRDELQRELAIATATYTRAKRQGLEQLAELLVQALHQQRTPIVRSAPPSVPPLLGRESALQYYTQRLHNEGLAVIWGLAGSGKTALAATLAAAEQTAGTGVVWHNCAGTDDGVLRGLLQSLGFGEAGQTLDSEALLGLAREQLKGGMLVLDAYEQIANDPTGDLLIAMLRGLVEREGLRLLVVGRVLPSWAHGHGWLPLGGLVEDMARALWTIHGGPAIDPAAWHSLYNRTLGFPQLIQQLTLAPGAPLGPFIWDHVCATVSGNARRILSEAILAIQPSRPPTDTAAPSAAAMQQAYATLEQHGLITRQADHGDYHLHGLLAANRAELAASIVDAAETNRSLGEQALSAEQWLEAASYFAAAGEIVAAMRILGEHLDALVQQKRGRLVIDLFRQWLAQLPPGPELAELHAQLGTIQSALGMHREALDALSAALDLATTFRDRLPPLDVRRWQRITAQAYLELGLWDRALSHAQIGMGGERIISNDVSAYERIELTLLQHRIWVLAGHKEQAQFWLSDAQMQARVSGCTISSALVAYAEGVIAFRNGVFDTAETLLRRALDLLPADVAHGERLHISAHLARCLAMQGRWAEASTVARTNFATAQALRHRSGTVQLAFALAYITMCTGALDEAWSLLGLAEALIDPANVCLQAQLRLLRGWLALHDPGAWDALDQFGEALALATNPVLPELSTEASLGLAVVYLRQGDPSTAVQYAQRVIRLASGADLEQHRMHAHLCLLREAILRHAFDEAQTIINMPLLADANPIIAGTLQRLSAELLAARGANGEADAAFRQSIATLYQAPNLLRTWAEQSYAAFGLSQQSGSNASVLHQPHNRLPQPPNDPPSFPGTPIWTQ